MKLVLLFLGAVIAFAVGLNTEDPISGASKLLGVVLGAAFGIMSARSGGKTIRKDHIR